MAGMEEVEVVVAHSERATLRVGDVFLKVDADQTRTDVEVEAMALAPVPTPRILWRKPPVLALAALPGCATEPGRAIQDLFTPSKGGPWLTVGLKQYDDGEYADAVKNLQAAIDQGLSNSDRVNAHKHLAFIHCSSNRAGPCRQEFGKALAIDPSLELTAAEAGHPVWGPIFRQAKAGR